MISLQTTAPIVLDSVSIAPADRALFSPDRLLGSWVSPGAIPQTSQVGQWPYRRRPLRCYVVRPAERAVNAPVLVSRIGPAAKGEVDGRKWSANAAIVVHYHGVDGTPYVAPFGFVVLFPNTKTADIDAGGDALSSSHPPLLPFATATSEPTP
jgi:hypothetical protein